MPTKLPERITRPWWGFFRCIVRGHSWYLPTLPYGGAAPYKRCRHCYAKAHFVPTIDGVVGQHLPPERPDSVEK